MLGVGFHAPRLYFMKTHSKWLIDLPVAAERWTNTLPGYAFVPEVSLRGARGRERDREGCVRLGHLARLGDVTEHRGRLRLKGQRRGEWAALETARSSTRGSGWAPGGPVFLGVPSRPEPPGVP